MPLMFFGMFMDLTEVQRQQLSDVIGIELPAPVEPRPPEPPSPPTVPDEPDRPPFVSIGPRFDATPGFVQAVIRRHFPEAAWEHAAAIVECESGFRPEAHNTAGEDSRGLFQINVVPAANIDLLPLGDLFNPDINAQAARIVWQRQGWRAWLNCARIQGVPTSGPGIP